MARPASDISLRIVGAARAAFLQHGVDGAKLRAIAKAAGTSIGMVYYYYPSKDELFFAVIDQTYDALIDDLSLAVGSEGQVAPRLEKLYLRLGALSDEEATVIRIIVRELLLSSPRMEPIVERFLRGHVPLILRLLASGAAQGTITDRHHPFVLTVATGVLGLFAQLARRQLGDERLPFAGLPKGADLARALTDVLLNGIGRKAAER